MMILLHLDQVAQKKMIYLELKKKFEPRRVGGNTDEASRYRQFHIALLTLIECKLVKRAKELDPAFSNEQVIELNMDYVYQGKSEEGEEKASKTAIPSVMIQPNLKLLKEDPRSSLDQVMIMRKEKIKGAIVRIMKDVKICPFDKIQQDLKRFPKIQQMEYSMQMLKECIDKLITDNFLMRDAKDRNIFTYIPE